MNGELEKLMIQAYEAADFSGEPISEFAAYVNPKEITIAYEMEYDSAQGSGTTGSRMEFKKVKPGDLALTLFLDGTGANGNKIDVQQQVEAFQTTTGYNGNIHRPNYLKVVWGTLQVKRCVLKSASIAYKIFKPSGTPLRAVITANFTDTADDETRVALAQDQSPDLTHVRLLKAGETLAGLCQQIYGDGRYYLKVARVNQLDNFRNIAPGTRIFFPPLEK
ncbi:peptidoglycan-binding protein [Halioxenophilus sp. WMMB6]|uniref:CIS tube protein n=1 Tax=Halioxenophilus sp. WMMB6 TaxID=3073815 RepID=UPI00295EF60A|nr:peptidoglycan-binding protein [Halioxenophilus sp. WMMB6]